MHCLFELYVKHGCLNNIIVNIYTIDFDKAFNSLNWNFLLKTLEYVNFGMTFIGFIKTMYNDIQSTILTNGTTCTYFKLQGGVRQGCPLSAYLFIIALDTLACKVRNDNTIKVIKIDDK